MNNLLLFNHLLNNFYTDMSMYFPEDYPQTYYKETENAQVIELVVPSVKQEELELSIIDAKLVIKFERSEESASSLFTGVQRNFTKSIKLRKDVKLEDISATLKNGVFRVEIAKKEPVKLSVPITVE